MAKIARKTQKIFGSTASVNQISKFGSLAAGAPAYTTDPATIQSLGNYLNGLFDAIIGSNSPAIEDMNALFYLMAYQLAYVMQAGVPEWDSGTTYYIGSFASDGNGGVYASITDTNLNNAVSDRTKWMKVVGPLVTAINPATQSPFTMTQGYNNAVFTVNCANGAQTFTLPLPATVGAGFRVTVKDAGNNANTNNITVARAGTEKIEGVAASKVLDSDNGSWTFLCDGTDWWLV